MGSTPLCDSRSRSKPIVSNCSQFMLPTSLLTTGPSDSGPSDSGPSDFPATSQLPRKKFHSAAARLSGGAKTARHIAQNLKLSEQQGAATMEARADGSDRAADALRSFLVAQLFELAKHDGFAEFAGQFENGGANLLHALLT